MQRHKQKVYIVGRALTDRIELWISQILSYFFLRQSLCSDEKLREKNLFLYLNDSVSLQNLMTVDCLGMFSTAPPLPHTFASLPAVANHKLAPTFPETKVRVDMHEKLKRSF